MISVAIASYNGAAHIGAQLASIAAQSRLPDELVVADDCSTDATADIVRRFGRDAPFPVRLVPHPANIGILENFYTAFAACTGNVIVYCDQDDVWRPDKLERQIAEIERGAALCMHPSAIVDGALEPLGRQEPFNAWSGLIDAPVDVQQIGGFGHQMMFRRAVLDVMVALRPIAQRISTTGLFDSFDRYIPFCASMVGPIAIVPEPLVRFRRHGGATSGAGLAIADRPPLRRRVRTKILDSETDAREAVAIVAMAVRSGAVQGDIPDRLVAALTRKAALAGRQVRLLRSRWIARPIVAAPAAWYALRTLGFGNEARMRSVKFTAAALIA